MTRTTIKTRTTTTTTYTLDAWSATLADLREFVETTKDLPGTTPVARDVFGTSLSVHATRLNEEDA